MHLTASGHFHALDALCPGKEPRYPWNRRPGGPRAGRFGEEERFLHLPSSIAYLLTVYIIPAPALQLRFHKFTLLAAETVVTQKYNNFMERGLSICFKYKILNIQEFHKIKSVIKLSGSTSGNHCCTQ